MSYFKTVVFLLCFTCVAWADSPILSKEDFAIIDKSRQIIEQAGGKGTNVPNWLKDYRADKTLYMDESKRQAWIPAAKEIADEGRDFVLDTIQDVYDVTVDDRQRLKTIDDSIRSDSPLQDGEQLYYFVSSSQPKSELVDIMQTSAMVDARIVLKGMRPQDTMVNQTARAFIQLGKHIRPLPKVSIDPRLYTVFNIEQAPSMVYRKGNKYVFLSGVTGVDWFLEQARQAGEGKTDLGNYSTTYDVVERDMIAEMKARTAAIDWESKKKKVVENFVKRLPVFTFPVAQEDHQYQIDPRIRVKNDILAKDGTLIAKGGTVINPTESDYGLKTSLFVFNAKSDLQRALVKKKLAQTDGLINLLITEIDKERGLDFIGDLERELNYPVFMLQERMIHRFQLRHVPSLVEVGDGKIIVSEYGMPKQREALTETINVEKD